MRLVIFRKPARGRFKLYVVFRPKTSGSRPSSIYRRMAVDDQPYHGFRTIDEALAKLDAIEAEPGGGRAAFRQAAMSKGSPIPAGEQSIRRGHPRSA